MLAVKMGSTLQLIMLFSGMLPLFMPILWLAWVCETLIIAVAQQEQSHLSGNKKQHKRKFFGPNFLRIFPTLTPGCPRVKKFLPITGAAGKPAFRCGRPRFLARTSMTRRVLEKLCTEKVCVDFLARNLGTQESFRQTKPNKDRFANRFAQTMYSCEFGVLSAEKQGQFTNIGTFFANLGFFLRVLLVIPGKPTPNSQKKNFFLRTGSRIGFCLVCQNDS